jgi:predicted AAA+ superfamily ATPase
MKRVYEAIIREHFERNSEMLFISGARQVGKTTLVKTAEKNGIYFNWDIQEDRLAILDGQRKLAEKIGAQPQQTVIFDELHKYADWKNFIKGFYDLYHGLNWKIIVTGSSRLDTYRKGGDSLLGRYFHLQMFPLSVAELAHTDFNGNTIQPPANIDDYAWDILVEFGGFPQPFIKANRRFHRQWTRTRRERLFFEDIRTLGRGYDIARIELLTELLQTNAGCSLKYASFARKLRCSIESVQRWITLLEQLSFCFTLRPWFKNVGRSIAKEPKIFLTDWSVINDPGKRTENFIACSLLKAISGWNDTGLGNYSLHYLRTKDGREVDFLIASDGNPWALIEVKTSDTSLSPNLEYFRKILNAPHTLQAVLNLPYSDIDCFSLKTPAAVPARTLLSQLL